MIIIMVATMIMEEKRFFSWRSGVGKTQVEERQHQPGLRRFATTERQQEPTF